MSFFINRLRKLGFIEYNGGTLEVHSSLLNVVLYDMPHCDVIKIEQRRDLLLI